MFALHNDAECILYNNVTDCNERRYKALHNGGQVSNLENMWWHLEVESISVRKGCRLTVFTGILVSLIHIIVKNSLKEFIK